jgi:hypothetical protein
MEAARSSKMLVGNYLQYYKAPSPEDGNLKK